MDFERGNLLYLTGTAEVIWDGDEMVFAGAGGYYAFISRLGIAWGGLPLRWSALIFALSRSHWLLAGYCWAG